MDIKQKTKIIVFFLYQNIRYTFFVNLKIHEHLAP